MNQYLLIGIAAGLATALLNLSGYAGGMVGLGFILVLLSSLPIMIAALGWGSFTGIIAALTSGITLALIFDLQAGFLFLVLNSLPAFWVAHLVGLSQSSEEQTLWYPLNRVLVWICSFVSMATMAMFIPFGFSVKNYRDTISNLMNQIYANTPIKGPDGEELDLSWMVDLVATMAPSISTVMLVISLVATLYLAAKITQMSGRLSRPWPDLHHITMPMLGIAIFLIALLVSSFGGLIGIFAQIIASSFGAGLLLCGLSVLHHITKNNPSRGAMLWGAYFLLVFFWWLGIALIILGAAETLIQVRSRFPKASGPTQSGE
ncbi:MAG: YybS family protein [Cohaesibacter sp.]|nr:YybS family protein [Cohaesibacter sp.]